jgi:hypothetical protein
VIGLTVPAVAADLVRADRRGLVVRCIHSTNSRTSVDVARSHSRSIAISHRHHRNSAKA